MNDADRLMKELQTKHIITKQNNSLKELYEFITPSFINQLNTIHPKLTEQDILYCVLMQQSYSTKQISNFFNITQKSVNQLKYRLKKKLGISKEVVISEFIKDLSSESYGN